MVWDLDFWGKYRRGTEAARANLLATEWARRAVTSTLVSNVAASYFQLRAYDLQLDYFRRNFAKMAEQVPRNWKPHGASEDDRWEIVNGIKQLKDYVWRPY
jgi:outer membrane protein TolC